MLVEAQSEADLQQQAVVQERQNLSLREQTLKDLEDAVLGRTIQLTARSEQIAFLLDEVEARAQVKTGLAMEVNSLLRKRNEQRQPDILQRIRLSVTH